MLLLFKKYSLSFSYVKGCFKICYIKLNSSKYFYKPRKIYSISQNGKERWSLTLVMFGSFLVSYLLDDCTESTVPEDMRSHKMLELINTWQELPQLFHLTQEQRILVNRPVWSVVIVCDCCWFPFTQKICNYSLCFSYTVYKAIPYTEYSNFLAFVQVSVC